MILITHDSHTLGRLADRRILLEEGRIAETVDA
jgi:ABC-type glutathione transport system ATPase component